MLSQSNLAKQDSAGISGDVDLSDLDTIDTLVEKSEGLFTETQVRWALRFRGENGLGQAVVKFGKRIYIHRPSFMRWFAGLPS